MLFLEKRSWMWSGVRRNESPRCRCCFPRCQSSFPRLSSCIFITKAVHSSTGWVTSASHRLTGEGGVSRQTNATQVFTPQPVERMFMNGMFVQSCHGSIKMISFLDIQPKEGSFVLLSNASTKLSLSPPTFVSAVYCHCKRN